jgi:hypothetical protein
MLSRDDSVDIATGWTAGNRFLVWTRDFSGLHSIHIGSGAYPGSYPMGTEGSLPRVKRPGREADHSLPSSAEVKNGGATPPLPHMPSWRSA